MKHFIKADLTPKVNQQKLDLFVDAFNAHIRLTEPIVVDSVGKLGYQLNDGLDDDVPELSDAEFQFVKEQAAKDGYLLSKKDDNYHTITYTLQAL